MVEIERGAGLTTTEGASGIRLAALREFPHEEEREAAWPVPASPRSPGQHDRASI
jgi:hypothetical protein